jgi:putative FmdB family regulatory protein
MPLYEYQCDACGHRFERIQKFSDPPVSACPTCDGPVRKLFSSPAIQFKGSGFYITDYVRSKGDGGASSDKAGADGAPSGAGKTDKKEPAAAPASDGSKDSTKTKTEPAKPAASSTTKE